MLGNPAGCGPAKLATVTEGFSPTLISAPGALQTYVLPSVNLEITASPFTKSFERSFIITAGFADNGRVSIAVTKIELGLLSSAGILP